MIVKILVFPLSSRAAAVCYEQGICMALLTVASLWLSAKLIGWTPCEESFFFLRCLAVGTPSVQDKHYLLSKLYLYIHVQWT